MTEDILERAKALRDDMDFVSDDCIKEHISELIAEVERLRSQSVDQVFRAKNEEISAQAARIKELSELNDGFMGNCNNLRSRCWRLEEENKRLSEAFLENQAEIEYYISQNRHFVKLWKYTDEVNKIDIRKKIEIKAREELDRIKEGGKDEQL